jgi:mitofusin 2
MRLMLDNIFERINDLRNQKLEQKKFLTDRISNTETQLMVVTREMKMKIHNMVEEVEQKVSKALNEEIWRLNVLVDEFNLPFHTDSLVLNVYKKEINGYVENGLGSNLRARLSTALAMNIETAQREMTDRMTALVPKEKFKEQTNQIITARTQPFEMLYTLNCQNLCSDFMEDLEFRFSWGITSLIQRFNARRAASKNSKSIKYRNNGNLNVSHWFVGSALFLIVCFFRCLRR